MAGRKKVTVDDIRADFEKAKAFFSDTAFLLPQEGDETKCVLVLGGDRAKIYPCSVLKGHLEFMLTTVE